MRRSTKRKQHEKLTKDALDYTQNIRSTLRRAFLVLDKTLRVVSAYCAPDHIFNVTAEVTQGRNGR